MRQKQFEDRELLIDFSSPLSTLRTDLNPANFYFKFNNRKIWWKWVENGLAYYPFFFLNNCY